ncbi:MAG TPA: dihydroorotase [Candidatus Merdibacter merdipullorum]|nr:dihydroorotase [Candidatus Merdibacter merdipullorum]
MKLLKNVHVLENNRQVRKEILFDETGILKIAEQIDAPEAEVIDGKEMTALPGLIDVHVHLREPGFAYKETIDTGTMAAAAGGFTTIMAMPNVQPYPDSTEVMEAYLQKIEADAHVHVIPYATITKAESGKEVVDMAALAKMGVRAFSDDGVGVQSGDVMEEAMKQSHALGTMIVAHTEDMSYRKPGAYMHEGTESKARGVVGIPSECEWKQLERDLKLVEKTGAHYHCCHVSAKESVQLLREYRSRGCDVSGEVTAHHLLLCDRDVVDANWKMNPPLRGEADRKALIRGLQEGALSLIANDHAPHSEEEKKRPLEAAPFGIVSLETAFPLLYTKLVLTGIVSLKQLVNWMSTAPAERFGLARRGRLEEGYASDFTLVDLNEEYIINRNHFLSKGRNTPFHGWRVKGKIKATYVDGTCVYEEGKQ